jgi:hypothetical protein
MVEAEYNYSSTGPKMTRVDLWIHSPLLPHLNSLRTLQSFRCPPTNMKYYLNLKTPSVLSLYIGVNTRSFFPAGTIDNQ